MYTHHSFETRLQSVLRYLAGESADRISKDTGIDDHYIVLYATRYKTYGASGLFRQPNVKATYELKLEIIEAVETKLLSLSDISVQYGVSISSIKKWLSISRRYGIRSLSEIKPRGRPSKDMAKQQSKDPLSELEKLQAEVRYLRAENDLLKKVKALVEKKDVQNKKSGHKPSKN